MIERLPELQAAIWAELERAAASPGHPWRWPVLATAQAGEPDARTMVLREAVAAAQSLHLYTDARSPKLRQLQPRGDRPAPGVLVMWSGALSWQLRLKVAIEVATDGLAVSSRWARLKMTPAAQDYLSPLPPGAALGSHHTPERDTRENFAFLSAQVLAIDWLELRAGGHRRACFDAEGARWLQP